MTGGTVSEQSAPETGERRSGGRGVWLFLRDVLIIFVVALMVSFLIKTFLVRSFYIPSGSMENTLLVNDRIIVNELTPGLVPLRHGDVVVFTDPGGWLTGADELATPKPSNPIAAGVDDFLTFIGLSSVNDNDHLVKRVIGLPGDHVACCNALDEVTVNGVPLNEPYITSGPGQLHAGQRFHVVVPKGKIWVLGDNRNNSQDSSLNQNLPGHGFVPIKDVVGRAIVVSWPFSHWKWLSNYPQVFADVEDGKR